MRARTWGGVRAAALILLASVLAAILPALPAAAAEPSSSAWYLTQTGDRHSVNPVSTRTWHADSISSEKLAVTGSAEAGSATVQVVNGVTVELALTFAATTGQALQPGTYANTRTLATGENPGLAVEERLTYLNCADLVGQFTVHEINADLSRLWITYEYRCRSGTAPDPVWGELQVGRPTPTGVLVTAARMAWPAQYPGVQSADVEVQVANVGFPDGLDVPDVSISGSPDFRIRYDRCRTDGAVYRYGIACAITLIFIPSGTGPRSATLKITHEAGTDTVALTGSGIAEHSSFGLYDKQGRFGPGGQHSVRLPADAVFSLRGKPSDVLARVDLRYRAEDAPPSYFEVRLFDPSGAALTTKSYSDRDTSELDGPQLDVVVNDQRCLFRAGEFRIDEIAFFADGEPRALRATFDLRCSTYDQGVFGSIAYRAAAEPAAVPQAPPGPVRNATAKGGLDSVVLSWLEPGTAGYGPYGGVEVFRSDDAEKPVTDRTGATPIRSGLLRSITVKGPFSKTGTAFTIFPRNGFGHYGPATVLRVHSTALSGVKVSAATVATGSSTTLSGQLRGNRNHADALAKRKLTIERRLAGSSTWSAVGSVTTDSAGKYTTSVKPPSTADYRLVYPGTTDTVGVVGGAQRVTVRPKVSLSASRTSAKLGTTFSFTTKLTPAQNGVELSLQRYSGGKWTTVAKKKTSNGSATFTHKPTTRGTHTYRVSKPVSTASTSNTSSSVKVKTT